MTGDLPASRRFHGELGRHLAGGVATAFRAAQRPVPVCFARGAGATITDIDGNTYVDYALGFGPLLLGHSPQVVLERVRRQLATGLGYGASHPLELELAEAICRTVPSAERCVIATTGSEAVQVALRIARSATGRRRVVKFLGHYDGWHDTIHTGVPGQTVAGPGTGGQDPEALASVTVCPWNDIDALEAVLGDDVAAVIMEPLHVNGGCIQPAPGYLARVRALTRRLGIALIFDEVITGYRVALGGAQERFGVLPDLTVLGKALGAGFPISAVCGPASIMDEVSSGRVAHVGTFNANPVCASAAVAAISVLEAQARTIYPQLADRARELASGLEGAGRAAGLPIQTTHDVGIVHAFVTPQPVTTYAEGLASDTRRYADFAEALLAHGVHVIPRGLLYVSTCHDADVVASTVDAMHRAAAGLTSAARRTADATPSRSGRGRPADGSAPTGERSGGRAGH